MQIVDLFSGIGGFSLAGHWAGWSTVQFCEIDSFCRKVLEKNFPGTPIHNDIKTLTRDSIIQGGIWDASQPTIVVGGFPCQPYSHAGKRKGNNDDRALWPQMFRVITEVAPTYVVGENVAGLITMDGGRVFAGIVADLESAGYTVEAFVIPACAVGAPHRRDRLWIIAHRDNFDSNGRRISRRRRGEFANENSPSQNAVSNGRTGFGCEEGATNGQLRYAFARDGKRVHNESATSDTSRSGRRQAHPNTEIQGWKLDLNRKCGATSHAECFGRNRRPQAKGRHIFDGIRLQERYSTPVFSEAGQCSGRVGEEWNEHWLPVATRLCRMDDGLSAELYFIRRLEHEIKSRNQEGQSEGSFVIWKAMRTMWEHRALAETSSELFVQRMSDTLSIVPCKGRSVGWIQEDEKGEKLRDMWQEFYSLPYEKAQHLQQRLLECYRQTERKEKMGQKDRGKRLKALGNAIVPQIAFALFSAIVNHENEVKVNSF